MCLAQKQLLPAQNTRMHVILKHNASTRWSLSIFTSRFHIHFSCTLDSGSFTLKCVKFSAERPTRLFVLGKLNFTSLFYKKKRNAAAQNLISTDTWHKQYTASLSRAPKYRISQFKCSFLRGLAGFVFFRTFTVYYRILECFLVQNNSNFSTFRRPYFFHLQESSRSALLTFFRNVNKFLSYYTT